MIILITIVIIIKNFNNNNNSNSKLINIVFFKVFTSFATQKKIKRKKKGFKIKQIDIIVAFLN